MSDDKPAASRRDFLRLAAAAAPAAAVTAVAAPAAADEKLGETAKAGLRQTEHTKKYYDTARF
jgi:hypothetical protein